MTDDFFVVRAVTLLEVFTRAWVAELIDRGQPYLERASELGKDIKFDITLVTAIHGRVITLGDLFAQNVSTNTFGQIVDIFSSLLAEKILPRLGQVIDTTETSSDDSPQPIVADLGRLSSVLTRLFEVRHILCHELPRKEVYQHKEISEFLARANEFSLATNEILTQTLYANYPATNAELKIRAGHELTEAEQLLAEVSARLEGQANDGKQRQLLRKMNKIWMEFRNSCCDYDADNYRGGTHAGLSWLLTAVRLTDIQTDFLTTYLRNDESE